MITIVKERNYPCLVLRSKTIEADSFIPDGFSDFNEYISLCFMVSAFDYFVIESEEISHSLEDFEERLKGCSHYFSSRGLKDSFAVSLPFYDEVQS